MEIETTGNSTNFLRELREALGKSPIPICQKTCDCKATPLVYKLQIESDMELHIRMHTRGKLGITHLCVTKDALNALCSVRSMAKQPRLT